MGSERPDQEERDPADGDEGTAEGADDGAPGSPWSDTVAEVMTSKRFWESARPLFERWLAVQEKQVSVGERLTWGGFALRAGFVVAIVALLWEDKIPKDAALTILGGIAGALFVRPKE